MERVTEALPFVLTREIRVIKRSKQIEIAGYGMENEENSPPR